MFLGVGVWVGCEWGVGGVWVWVGMWVQSGCGWGWDVCGVGVWAGCGGGVMRKFFSWYPAPEFDRLRRDVTVDKLTANPTASKGGF